MKYYHYIDIATNSEYIVRAFDRDGAERLACWALKDPALNGEITAAEADALNCPILWYNHF